MIYIPIRAHFAEELPDRVFLTQLYYDIINASAFFVFVIIKNTIFSDKFIHKCVLAFKLTVVLAALVSIIQVFDQSFYSVFEYLNEKDLLDNNIYLFRRLSIFGFVDSNELGLSFIPLLSILVGYQLKNGKEIWLFLILGTIITFLTNTRYVMIGFIILTFQILISKSGKINNVFRYILLIAVILATTHQVLMSLGYDMNEWINQRLFAEGDIKESTRYGAFTNFSIFFPHSPFFGTGVHLTEEIRQASRDIGSSQIHVGYLSHLVSYGLVGSFFLFSFWYFLAKDLFETAKKTKYWGSFFAFLIYFWAQATLVNFSMIFTGLIFALVFDKYYKDKKYPVL